MIQFARENQLIATVLTALPFLIAYAFLTACSPSSTDAPPVPAPVNYTLSENWPDLPSSLTLGAASGVAIDSHDHIFMLHRGPNNNPSLADTILQIDADTGMLITSWGQGLFTMPHGMAIDIYDNIWVTDIHQHQVYKFSHSGDLLLTLGERNVPGTNGTHFNGPTDIAFDLAGNIYISDGQGNNRISKFSQDGQYLYSWGTQGQQLGMFDTPHGIAIDGNTIYVADRGNKRIQLFDLQSNFIAEWKNDELGRPWGLAANSSHLFMVDGGDPGIQDRSQALQLDHGGIILDKWGRHGNLPGEFNIAHDIDVDSNGNLYIVEIDGKRIQKYAPVTTH